MVLEYRLEQTKKQVVVVANERAARPTVFGRTKVTCPFDKGAEKMTPPTKLALPGERQWTVRAFDNAFAFLKRRGKFKPMKNGELYWTSPAFGDHEVIVETDKHGALYQDLGQEQLLLAFEAYSRRFKALSAKKGVKCVFLFKNHGLRGGASIEHEHSQVVAMPFVPPLIQAEVDASRQAGECLHCALLGRERRNVLAKNDYFTAICPSYGRFPYETWVVANEHCEDFTKFSGAEAAQFMQMLRDSIARVYAVSKDYTIAFHNSPKAGGLHFHAEIYPRPNVWAGMEIGGGIIINTKSEANALAALKAVKI